MGCWRAPVDKYCNPLRLCIVVTTSTTLSFPSTTMFKKPPAHLSNSTPLRQSDRRKVLAVILELYPEIVRGLDEASAKNVGKVLVPEGLRSGGMETSAGVQGVSGFLARCDSLTGQDDPVRCEW
jgi:hypothetical protein